MITSFSTVHAIMYRLESYCPNHKMYTLPHDYILKSLKLLCIWCWQSSWESAIQTEGNRNFKIIIWKKHTKMCKQKEALELQGIIKSVMWFKTKKKKKSPLLCFLKIATIILKVQNCVTNSKGPQVWGGHAAQGGGPTATSSSPPPTCRDVGKALWPAPPGGALALMHLHSSFIYPVREESCF